MRPTFFRLCVFLCVMTIFGTAGRQQSKDKPANTARTQPGPGTNQRDGATTDLNPATITAGALQTTSSSSSQSAKMPAITGAKVEAITLDQSTHDATITIRNLSDKP